MKLRSSLAALLLLATAHSIQARPKPFSLVRSGTVVASHNEATFYSFRVRRGQTISARIQSKTRHFVPFVAILSPSNRNLMWDARTFYSAKTTETGVYRARVGVNLTGTNAARGAYRLEISVR